MPCSARTPFFSVIIATYNRARFLPIAVESVLTQTFADFELLIVDDGSTDRTRSLIERYTDARLRYIRQEQAGVSAARNNGVRQAQGSYIAFLDSDDRYRKDKLEITAAYIRDNPDYKIFHTEEIWYRNGQLLAQKGHHRKPSGNVFAQSLKLCCISISTAAIKRDIFEQVGHFDEQLPACEDYDFWLRVTARHPVLLISEYLTIKEGGHPDQQSKKYPAMDKFRIYALEKLLRSGRLDKGQYSSAYEELNAKCRIYRQGALKRNKTKEARYCRKIVQELKTRHE